jgi:predicted glycosyltransferase involved in capsule biosynthesis
MDLTFLIPTRIETEDRLRNIISSVSYLLKHIPAKVIVKEVSEYPTFKNQAIPEIEKYVDISNLEYLYEKSQDPWFCKSKVLNDLIVASNTKVVVNYDADVIIPIEAYFNAYNLINDDLADVVYPYQCGIYQWKADYNQDIYEEFINQLDISVLDKQKTLSNSTIGWTQFINRQVYIDSFMMNENFISWGCEDDEFYYRMSVLGNRIARIDNYVYHLEHSRTNNSWFSNPNFDNNYQLWNTIKTFDKKQLMQYYENQIYVQTRKMQIIK